MKKLLLTVLMSGITGMASADIVPGKTYRIASAANEERVMFVDNSSLANNTSVVVWTDTEVPAQQLEAIANGEYLGENPFGDDAEGGCAVPAWVWWTAGAVALIVLLMLLRRKDS